MVWLGRKRNRSNLLFSLLSLAFFGHTVVSLICGEFSLGRLQTVAHYLFPPMYACLPPLFGLSTGITTVKMKRFVITGSGVIIFLGAGSACFFLAGGGKRLSDTVFFTA